MLRREIEQRKAFQQAYEAQMELAAELRAVAGMRPNGQTPETVQGDERRTFDHDWSRSKKQLEPV